MPWFLFWILALQAKLEWAALSGLLSLFMILAKNRRQGRSIKSLQIGTLIFFILFALSVPVLGREIISRNVDLIGNAAILTIILVTIVLKRPFSIDFARERTEERLWNDPHFIRVNYQISWLWLAVLLFNFSLVVARHFSFLQIDRWLSVAIRIFNCIVAAKISFWYGRKEGVI